ncbi:metallophosphoesterase, partial [bacterium]|nr:metallophosphoesterase [bacterium]
MKHLKTLTAIIVLIILSGCNTFQPRRMPLSNLIENSPFEFVVIGDSRPGERAYPENPASASIQYLNNINWINQINPVFSINIGDLILGYNTVAIGLAEKQWDIFDKTVELYRAPLFMVVGNHDVWDEFSDKLYQKRYGPHYYSWNYGDCSFIALSSEVLGEADKIGPGQRKWLEKTLIKTQKSKFRFVFLHRPVWWNNENGTNLWMEQIHPLLKKYKVDTVFAGHCHHYEPKEIDGIRYIITGGGGAEIGNNEGIGDFFHFLKVTVDENPRPEINVIRENRVLPLDVVKPGLRNTVKGIFDHKTIFTDSSDKTQILLPVNNYMKEKINVNFKLISYENKLFQPTNIIVNLAPGEANTAKFSVAENIKNLELKISVNQQKNVLAENNFMIFLPRKGTYSDKKNQRNELIAKEANQIVFGNQNWLGTNDCSAVAWVTKTETGFVVTVKVTDDILVTKDSKDFWNTDGV